MRGAATADTIRSAKHSATSSGFRSRVDDCVYSVMTSDALPKMPPNTTTQYKAIRMKSSQLERAGLSLSNDLSVEFSASFSAVASTERVALADRSGCSSDVADASDSSEPASTAVAAADDAADIGFAFVPDQTNDDNDDEWPLLGIRALRPRRVLLSSFVPSRRIVLLLPVKVLLGVLLYWLSCCVRHVESWPIIYVNQII